jgi:hypothetical protein
MAERPSDAAIEGFYWSPCWDCDNEWVCVNMYGMGTCPDCGALLPKGRELLDSVEVADTVTITVSREGARSFVSESGGWGAIGLQEVDEALWEALGRPDRDALRPSEAP